MIAMKMMKGNNMKALDLFWDLLTKKVELLQNLPDDIVIDVVTEFSNPIRIMQYEISILKSSVEVGIPAPTGEDMRLTLFSKKDYNWVNKEVSDENDYYKDEVERLVDEEMEGRLRLHKEIPLCETLWV